MYLGLEDIRIILSTLTELYISISIFPTSILFHNKTSIMAQKSILSTGALL